MIILYLLLIQVSGLEISENRHLPCITKSIHIYGENLIFTRNLKIFTCPAAWGTRKYERTSGIFEPWVCQLSTTGKSMNALSTGILLFPGTLW